MISPPYLLAALLLAGTMGMALSSLLLALKPGWHRRKRIFVASLFLPAITLAGTLAMTLFVNGHADPTMRDLAVGAVIRFGALFTALAFFGSLAGAAISRGGRTR